MSSASGAGSWLAWLSLLRQRDAPGGGVPSNRTAGRLAEALPARAQGP